MLVSRKFPGCTSALACNNKELEVTDWLVTLGTMILEAQKHTTRTIRFLIEKTRFYDEVRGKLNERQEKAIARVFREGRDDFEEARALGTIFP
jgi:hypothetical protein